MRYPSAVLPESSVPRAADPLFQHIVDTYASEINKIAAVWRAFNDADLGWRPHPQSATVEEILRHELLSQRRFFGEFLGNPEPDSDAVLPSESNIEEFIDRLQALAQPRLNWMATVTAGQWLHRTKFFDVEREAVWVFWRRVLHSAHHRTQLTVYLRLMNRAVPPVYGPTADLSWSGADPTHTTDAAQRR